MDEPSVRKAVECYLEAFGSRDVASLVELFSDDAEMVEPVGTFTGKEGVRRLLDWDVKLSPVARSRPAGVELIIKGNVAIEEEVLEQTYEGISYEYPLVRVFEIDAEGKIRRLRVYLDRLGMMHTIAERTPGIKGRVFRGLMTFIVAQAEQGLRRA